MNKKLKIDLLKEKLITTSVFTLQNIAGRITKTKSKYIDLINVSIHDIFKIYESIVIACNLHLAGYELMKIDDLRKIPKFKTRCLLCNRLYQKPFTHKLNIHEFKNRKKRRK